MSTQGFKEFSFGHGDEHVGVKSKRWKGEQGNTYRFSFINFPGVEKGKPDLDQEGPKFIGAYTHYIPGAGYIVNKGAEYTKLAGEPPRSRIATVIVVWPTDRQGNINKARVAEGEIDVRAWVFSDDKYKTLNQINKEFPFGHHDVTANVSDTQYQKMTISPCKESLLRALMANPKATDIIARVLSEAQDIAANLNSEVGVEMTIEQIRAKMTGAAGAAGGPAKPATGASSVPAVTGDVDGLLDNILDT